MADPKGLRAAAAKLGARLAHEDSVRKHSAAQTRDAENAAIRDKYRRIAEHRRYPKKDRYSWEELVIGSMAMDAGINRYYAMKAGRQAKKALDYLAQAAQAAKPETKVKALRLARKHLTDVSRDHHPELVEQLEGRILWEEGWRPETWDAERNAPREYGPSINPQTGQQEFSFMPLELPLWQTRNLVKAGIDKILKPFTGSDSDEANPIAQNNAEQTIGPADTQEQWLDEAEKKYRGIATAGNAISLDRSAEHLRHYLDRTGTPLQIPAEEARKVAEVLKAEQANRAAFESGLLGKEPNKSAWDSLSDLQDGEERYLDNNMLQISQGFGTKDHLRNGDYDWALAVGSGRLNSSGNLKASRSGQAITLSGDVTHSINDTYDFHPDAEAGLTYDAKALEWTDRAKRFPMQSSWTQPLNAQIIMDPVTGKFTKIFKWGDIKY